MQCAKCDKKAVNTNLCKDHFIEFFEDKVYQTIDEFDLIKDGQRVAVAVSGGKDSLTILNILAKKYDVYAIAIDEGIEDYRETTLNILKEFCNKIYVELSIYSFEDEFGASLDRALELLGEKPCTVCGIFRRYLLNKYSANYDVLATGHNLDDESQVILMNLLKNQVELLARMGPKSGIIEDNKFITRIKPLYFLSEKQVMAYIILNGIPTDMKECPYAFESFRAKVRDKLNNQENLNKGTKLNIINKYLSILSDLKNEFKSVEEMAYCSKCSQPSKQEICNSCKLIDKLKLLKEKND